MQKKWGTQAFNNILSYECDPYFVQFWINGPSHKLT